MVNDTWVQVGLHCLADFQPSGCLLDHSPYIVLMVEHDGSRRKSFRVFNMWTNHDDFRDVVQIDWNHAVLGTKHFILCKKLHHLKGALRKLNEKHFGHISNRVEAAKSNLKVAQLELHDSQLQYKVQQLRKEAMHLCEAERNFYFQKAKCSYLKSSDICSKFFHSRVKRNTKKNYIVVVAKEDGTLTTSQN